MYKRQYFFLAQHIIGSITSPLETIIQFIQKGPQYSLQHRVRIKEQNELSILADQINFMLDQIRDLTTADLKNQAKLYEIEIANSQARLMSLQSQMNPHFLYNTDVYKRQIHNIAWHKTAAKQHGKEHQPSQRPV